MQISWYFDARYLMKEKKRGKALDSVANFHLQNGAVCYWNSSIETACFYALVIPLYDFETLYCGTDD